MGTFEEMEESRYNRQVEESMQALWQQDRDKILGVSLPDHIRKVASEHGLTLSSARVAEIVVMAKDTYVAQTTTNTSIEEAVSIMEMTIEKAVKHGTE